MEMECSRFKNPKDNGTLFETAATMAFLKLRSDGCRKKDALKFSITPRCKIDGSIKKAGPSKCQTLKPIFEKTQMSEGG